MSIKKILLLTQALGFTLPLIANGSPPHIGNITDGSCSGTGKKIVCAVTARTDQREGFYTTDSGKHWFDIPVIPLPYYEWVVMSHVACKKTSDSFLCVTGGLRHGGTHQPYDFGDIRLATEKVQDWHEYNPYMNPNIITFVRCIGSKPVCFAGSAEGRAVRSSDGGANWDYIDVPGGGKDSALSVTESNGNAIFLKGGSGGDFIAKSNDMGATWSQIQVKNTPPNSSEFTIIGTSCSENTNTAVCSAVGSYKNDHSKIKPFIAFSRDGGSSWNYQLIQGGLPDGILNSTSCAKSGSSFSCVAVGTTTNPNKPLIIQTNDGENWQPRNFPANRTQTGSLNVVSCGNYDEKLICTSGSDSFIQSDDGGIHWYSKSIEEESKTDYHIKNIRCDRINDDWKQEVCALISNDFFAISTDGRQHWKKIL